MPYAIQIHIGIPAAAFSEASRGVANKALHEHSPELAEMERHSIEGRTPYRTGALRDAASAKPYKSEHSRSLVKLYYNDEPQLFEWHRVYAQYQEGPPMGHTTYTNDPRLMLYHVQDDDRAQIEAWAQQTVQTALDEWTAGAQAEADAAAAVGEAEAL